MINSSEKINFRTLPDTFFSVSTSLLPDCSTAYTVVFDAEVDDSVSTDMNIELKPNVIYFREDHSSTPKCTGRIKEDFNFTWTMPSTWAELANALQESASKVTLLAIHVDMLARPPGSSAIEFMDALTTITKFMPCKDDLRIGIVIKKDTPRSLIKELQRTQCQGVLLDGVDYSIDDVNKSINALSNSIPYWPKHILDNLPGSPTKIKHNSEITLTPRQGEILKLIQERGASNKTIAKILNITESTVKLHVGKLLEKFNVKNRTQLAMFSK